ncbi:MAG: GerMN domain-containing protein [Homoserinimonas sp.]
MSSRKFSARMRRLALVALATAAAVVLSSCVTIPTSGPVITGREVSEEEDDERFEVVPEGPVAGAGQEMILSGFLQAHSGSGSYDVAREFLSEALAEEWEPRESVLIRTGNSSIERVGETAMTYNIVVSAIVDSEGTYTAYPLAPQTLNYELVQEGGEWRISAAPDGIVLASGTFSRLFNDHTLYFLDLGRQTLVPDLRWFPGGAAATRIVSTLLNGPPPWLQGAVGTAFPEGTQLSSPRRVAVEAEVAVVELTEEALTASEAQRQLMRAQLEASLVGVGSINTVELRVGSAPLTIAPLGAAAPQLRRQVDSRMLVLQDGEFGYLANSRITPIDGLSEKVVATAPTEVALGGRETVAATLSSAGVHLVRTGAESPALVDDRPGLIAPTLDNYGYIWTVQRGDPRSIRVIDLNGNQSAVQTTLPTDAEIVSLEVSRDGARIAALLATDAGTRLIVASIIRDQGLEYVPTSFGTEPRLDVIVDSGTALDATWVDELSVATLSGIGGTTEVVSHQVGGEQTTLGSPGPAVAIVGGNGENGLRVLGPEGVVSARRGSGWQGGPTVTLIATQH